MATNPSVNPEQDAARSATSTPYPLDAPRKVSTPENRARRQALKSAVGALIFGAVGWLGWTKYLFPSSAKPPQDAARPKPGSTRLGKAADFASGAPPQIVTLDAATGGESESYVIQNVGGNFRVLSAKCTHQGCIVGWSPDEGALLCPCHAAQFNWDGKVLKGPAKLPLPVLNARVADGIVFVEG